MAYQPNNLFNWLPANNEVRDILSLILWLISIVPLYSDFSSLEKVMQLLHRIVHVFVQGCLLLDSQVQTNYRHFSYITVSLLPFWANC